MNIVNIEDPDIEKILDSLNIKDGLIFFQLSDSFMINFKNGNNKCKHLMNKIFDKQREIGLPLFIFE